MNFEIVLIIVIGVVILGVVALWFGRGLTIRKDGGAFSLEAKAAEMEEKQEENISVGSDLEIGETGSVGDIVGTEGGDRGEKAGVQNVDVLSRAKIAGKTGDIVGKRDVTKPRE